MATQDECAQHIDMARRTFIDYVNRGIITPAPAGEYDLDTVRGEYLSNLRSRVHSGEHQAQRLGKEMDDARRARALADKAEHEAEEMNAELLPVDQAASVIVAVVEIMRWHLLAVPDIVVRKLKPADGKAAIRELRREISEALEPLDQLVATFGPAPKGTGARRNSAT